MNETLQTILNRRSTRAFKPEMPENAALDAIIKSAVYAPSGMNRQDWHFTLVKNAELISKINREIRPLLPEAARERMTGRNNGDPDFSIFYFAPVLIFVSPKAGDGGSVVNCALATQNICLAAESLGLGSCIIGMAAMLFDSPKADDYLKMLKIPDGFRPMHAVCIGYKNMESSAPDRAPDTVTVIE